MKNGTVKISCALAALALVITAGLSGCGVETNNKNGASPKQNTATSSKNKKQFAKNVPDVAAAARYGETHRHLSGAAAPAARSRCAVHGQKPDDCRGDARRAGSWVLLYHH